MHALCSTDIIGIFMLNCLWKSELANLIDLSLSLVLHFLTLVELHLAAFHVSQKLDISVFSTHLIRIVVIFLLIAILSEICKRASPTWFMTVLFVFVMCAFATLGTSPQHPIPVMEPVDTSCTKDDLG